MESLRLTRIGREIASVLPPPPFHSEYFTGVGEWFAQLLGESGTVESRPESSDVWDVLKVDMNKFFEDSRPFELVFDEQSWQRNGDDFQIVIPARQHKKTSPTATVFHGRPPTFSECMCPVSTDADGGIVVTPSKPFAGKVVIK